MNSPSSDAVSKKRAARLAASARIANRLPPSAAELCRVCIACALVLGLVAAASAPSEDEKIEALIRAVAELGDAKFVRNGTTYDAKAAAEHLRRKRANAGSRVKTADDFIRFCGTGSSMSGKPYEIRWEDGRVTSSESFLRAKLAELEGKRTD